METLSPLTLRRSGKEASLFPFFSTHQGQKAFNAKVQGCHYVLFAEACGGAGFACARPEEVRPVLEAAWRIADRPALVEATIDHDADVSPPNDYLSGG